jgi:hypothetical protein
MSAICTSLVAGIRNPMLSPLESERARQPAAETGRVARMVGIHFLAGSRQWWERNDYVGGSVLHDLALGYPVARTCKLHPDHIAPPCHVSVRGSRVPECANEIGVSRRCGIHIPILQTGQGLGGPFSCT